MAEQEYLVCLFVLICLALFFTVESTIFHSCRDGSTWVDSVLNSG